MADTLQFDLVSPERTLASMAAVRVEVPGVEGDFTAMPRHAPFLSTLRPGIVRVVPSGGEAEEYMVTGGFAEVAGEAATVLAERAFPRAEVTAEILDELADEAERRLAEADPQQKPEAAQRVRDVAWLRKRLGLAG